MNRDTFEIATYRTEDGSIGAWGMRKLPCGLTIHTAPERPYHVVKGGKATRASKRHHDWCREARFPAIRVRKIRGAVYSAVDLDPMGYPARFDATADVKVRAILGAPFDDGVFDDSQSCSYYHGVVRGDEPDAIGEALAEAVADGHPFVDLRGFDEREDAPRRVRGTDWDALAEFWAARMRDEATVRAIRSGFYLYRGVKDSDYFDYQAYCDLSGRPCIRCGVRRGGAHLWFESGRRVRRELPDDVADRVRAAAESAAGRAATRSMHCPIGRGGGQVIGLPESAVEAVAAELLALHRSEPESRSPDATDVHT